MRDVIHCLRGTEFCPSCPLWGTIWGQKYKKNMKTGRKYGEKEKIQILIKSLIYRILRIYIFSFYAFLFFVLFADAEIRKDILQDFIRRDDSAARNLAQVPDHFANLFTQQVRGKACVHSFQCMHQ